MKNIYEKLYNRVITQKIIGIYNSQVKNSKKRGHEPPEYSKEEFLNWCFTNLTFHNIFKDWVKNNFEKDLAPSIDRIDDYKGYSFDNIRVCRFRENYLRSHMDIRNGINTKTSKTVLKFDSNGKFLCSYYSSQEASRKNKISQGSISACCNNNRKSAGGFKWKYKI